MTRLHGSAWIFLVISMHSATWNFIVGSHFTNTAIIHKLLEDYDPKLPPNFNNRDSAITVACGIYINSFDSVDESSMDYSISIFLRQQWTDRRLRYEHLSNETLLSLDWRMLERLWVPDLFVSNEKEAHVHEVMTRNINLRMYPGGKVHYSARVSFLLSCPMFLHKFPLDTQVCEMTIETFAYEINQLEFQWLQPNPVEFREDLHLPQFQLVKHTVASGMKVYSTGNFSVLRASFFLKRDIGYYMIQIYIPSVLIVILSWVSFWISLEAVPARISLGVLTVLTMTTQTSGLASRLPKVSYIKAIDVWLSTCLVFVFAALLEFAFVNVLCRSETCWRPSYKPSKLNGRSKKMKEYKEDDNTEVALKSSQSADENDGSTRGAIAANKTALHFQHQKRQAQTVDNLSRIFFPIAFVLFNALYWVMYYNTPDHVS